MFQVPSVRVTTERKAPDFWAPGGYSFGSIVTFSSTRYGQTGEYTCRPVGDEGSGGQSEGQGSSPVFLFVPGKRLFVLNKEEETDNVTVVSAKESSSWVGLPCVVTDPGAEVDLFSVQRDGVRHLRGPLRTLEWSKVSNNEHILLMSGFETAEIEFCLGIRSHGRISIEVERNGGTKGRSFVG